MQVTKNRAKVLFLTTKLKKGLTTNTAINFSEEKSIFYWLYGTKGAATKRSLELHLLCKKKGLLYGSPHYAFCIINYALPNHFLRVNPGSKFLIG